MASGFSGRGSCCAMSMRKSKSRSAGGRNAFTRRTTSLDSRKLWPLRSEEHTSELQSLAYLVCRLLLEKKKHIIDTAHTINTHRLPTAPRHTTGDDGED